MPWQGFRGIRQGKAGRGKVHTMRRKLNAKQKEYCRQRAAGKGYADAYTAAGYCPDGTRETAAANAINMERHRGETSTRILQEIERLQALADKGAILTLDQIKTTLAEFITDPDRADGIRLKAADQLARMQGGYTDKVEQTTRAAVTIEDKAAAAREMIAAALQGEND